MPKRLAIFGKLGKLFHAYDESLKSVMHEYAELFDDVTNLLYTLLRKDISKESFSTFVWMGRLSICFRLMSFKWPPAIPLDRRQRAFSRGCAGARAGGQALANNWLNWPLRHKAIIRYLAAVGPVRKPATPAHGAPPAQGIFLSADPRSAATLAVQDLPDHGVLSVVAQRRADSAAWHFVWTGGNDILPQEASATGAASAVA